MKKIILAVFGAFDLWIIASWLNIAATNYKPGLTSAAWNIFNLIF